PETLAHEDPRHVQDSVAKDGSTILGLPRSRKGAWRRGALELSVGGDLFLRDGNLRWRRRAVSDFNPLSSARSPSCRDCSFLPVVRYRSHCRNRPVSDRTQREKSHETEVRTTNRRFPPQPSARRTNEEG